MAYNKTKKAVTATQGQPGKTVAAETGGTKKSFSVNLRLALFLAIISFLVYGNTLKNNFAVDDIVMITGNSIVTKGIKAIPELFSTPHQRGYGIIPNDEYRPLPLVLFAVEYQFFGKNATPFHFMNLLLFAACVVLLFRFLDSLMDGKKTAVAFIASLLFALHPIHTEVVANIKSSDELLSFFFAFLSMDIYRRYAYNGQLPKLLAGALCFFLSLLSKESVITFIVIIPLFFFFFRKENKKRSVHIFLSVAAAIVVFMVIRFSVLNYYHANNISTVGLIENALAKPGLSLESRVATAILILGYYLKLLFVPYPLTCDYSYNTIPFTHFSDPLVLLSLALYIFLAVFSIARFLKNRQDLYAFGILFFLITISLVSNIFFLIKSTMGERLLFSPSVGFCLVAALLIEKWTDRQARGGLQILKHPKALWIIAPICVAYTFITIDRNSDWADNYTLYKADVKKAPDNCRLNYYYGYQLQSLAKEEPNPITRTELLDGAIGYFRKALSINPDYYYPVADLGAAYFAKNQLDSAELYDLAALQQEPDVALTRNNLSGVYLREKKYREDIGLCKESINLIPKNIYAYADMGVSYTRLGKYDSAAQYLDRGIAIDPHFFGFYAVFADLYHAAGNEDSAKKYKAMAQKTMAEGGQK